MTTRIRERTKQASSNGGEAKFAVWLRRGIWLIFRVYRLGPDNRIQSGHDIECATDEQARQAAVKIIDRSSGAEIWQGTRMVDRVAVQMELTASK